MLALNTGRHPLINPAAFHFGSGSLWMTTSRHASKFAFARRDPRAAFIARSGNRCLLLQGIVDAYDFRSVSGQLRGALDAPRLYPGMAGYILKNAAFAAGYLFELARIPTDWWPQNRVVLRLRPTRVRSLVTGPAPSPRASRLPGVPADVARSLSGIGSAYVCWLVGGMPLLAPALWAESTGDVIVAPMGVNPPARPGVAALVVERHHSFRATRMLGACLRGRLLTESGSGEVLRSRYGGPVDVDVQMRLVAERATWWRGFQVKSGAIARSGSEERDGTGGAGRSSGLAGSQFRAAPAPARSAPGGAGRPASGRRAGGTG